MSFRGKQSQGASKQGTWCCSKGWTCGKQRATRRWEEPRRPSSLRASKACMRALHLAGIWAEAAAASRWPLGAAGSEPAQGPRI